MKWFLAMLVTMELSLAQDKNNDPNVNYEYKKYESIDLGDLEIKGNLVSPTDISVRSRRRKSFSRRLYNRTEFDEVKKEDVTSLR